MNSYAEYIKTVIGQEPENKLLEASVLYQRSFGSLCRCLFPHLHPWKYFCTDRYGNEPVHYNTGICKDQYAHHRYWCSDQYYP